MYSANHIEVPFKRTIFFLLWHKQSENLRHTEIDETSSQKKRHDHSSNDLL
jgi:hypothetical protein